MTGMTGNLFSHKSSRFYLTINCMVQPILLWQFQSFFIVSKSVSKHMNSQPLLLLLPRREEKGEGLTVYVGPTYIQKFVLLRERICCPLYKKKKFISAYHYFTCELSAIIPRSEGISCIVKKILHAIVLNLLKRRVQRLLKLGL